MIFTYKEHTNAWRQFIRDHLGMYRIAPLIVNGGQYTILERWVAEPFVSLYPHGYSVDKIDMPLEELPYCEILGRYGGGR